MVSISKDNYRVDFTIVTVLQLIFYVSYHPPPVLREGYLFMYVCPSVSHSVRRRRGPHVTIAHDTLDLTVRGRPPTEQQTWDPPSRVLTFGGHRNTVGKQVVRTLLECFLVFL